MHRHSVQTAAPKALATAFRRAAGRPSAVALPSAVTDRMATGRCWTWKQTLGAQALHIGGGLQNRIEVEPA